MSNVDQIGNFQNKYNMGPWVKPKREYPENFKPGVTTPGPDLVPFSKIIEGHTVKPNKLY